MCFFFPCVACHTIRAAPLSAFHFPVYKSGVWFAEVSWAGKATVRKGPGHMCKSIMHWLIDWCCIYRLPFLCHRMQGGLYRVLWQSPTQRSHCSKFTVSSGVFRPGCGTNAGFITETHLFLKWKMITTNTWIAPNWIANLGSVSKPLRATPANGIKWERWAKNHHPPP